MEVQLTIHQPDGAVTQHRFSEEPVTIGSAIANHIVFEDPQLAPHQLIIFRERGNWVIRNLARGVELTCNHEFVEPGNTIPLPVQAELQMGSYRIEWVSEAAPEDASPELARPSDAKVTRGRVSREDGAPVEDDDMPTLRSPRKRTETPGVQSAVPPASPQVARQVGGVPAEGAAAGPMAGSAPSTGAENLGNLGPLGGNGGPIAPGDSPTLPTAARDIDPSDTASIRDAIMNVAPQGAGVAGEPAPIDMGPAPAAPEIPTMPSSGDANLPPMASAPPAPSGGRRTAVDPFALDTPAQPASSDARVGVDGYRVMTPARVYPFLVSVSAKSGAGGVVRVVPSFPGCTVTPSAARIDATNGQGGAKFWVTPIAVGKHEDACVDLTWQGAKPVRLKVPCRVASQDASKLWAFIGSMCAVAAILVYRGRWKVMDQLRDGLPPEAYKKTEDLVWTLGGPVNVCLLFAILFMIGAVLAIVLRRPRKVRLAAKRP